MDLRQHEGFGMAFINDEAEWEHAVFWCVVNTTLHAQIAERATHKTQSK